MLHLHLPGISWIGREKSLCQFILDMDSKWPSRNGVFEILGLFVMGHIPYITEGIFLQLELLQNCSKHI